LVQILTRHAGKWEIIGGVNCYVATPIIDYSKEKVILYLADGFGPQLVNNRVRGPWCHVTFELADGEFTPPAPGRRLRKERIQSMRT